MGYMWQLSQLVAAQVAHELPVPAIGADSPSLFLEKEAKREKIRLAACWHRGHGASSSALLMERNSSNLQSHSGQTYS